MNESITSDGTNNEPEGIIMFTDSIYELLILIGLILILTDFFIPTDVSSLIAHGLFAYCITKALDLPILYSVIIGIVAWLALIALHYCFFKQFITRFCNTFVSKTVINELPMDRLIGSVSKVECIDSRMMIRLEGDLIPFESSGEHLEGVKVKVVKFKDGVAVVTEA